MKSLIEKNIKYNGLFSFWSLTDKTCRRTLIEGFEEIGLISLIPSPKKDTQALNRALSSIFRGKDAIIKTIPGTSGYTVCGRKRSSEDKRTRYIEALRVTFDPNGNLVYEDGALDTSIPNYSWIRMSIQDEFDKEKTLVSSSSLGTILSKAITHLGGIPLGPKGGKYWIPNSSRDRWDEIAEVVGRANGDNRIYCVKTTTDEGTVTAVCDSLVRQVNSKLDALSESIDSEDLKKRALLTREREARELDTLVLEYEKILGKTLTDLREKASEVEEKAALAIFTASAAT